MDSAPPPPAVDAHGLTKSYGETVALDGVDFTLAPGELRGLLGPNGAGKTTLLRCLLDLATPDAGSVELLGRRRDAGRGLPPRGVAGFVEDPAFYPYLSGRANLEVLADLDDGDRAGIDDALDRLGLTARAGDKVAGYSTGMRQRLGIAAALLRDPRLLLLDEPTSGLDPAGIRAVGGLLGQLARDGVAVVVSSHVIDELEALCHSYTVVRRGRVVWDGDAAALVAQAPGSVHLLQTSDDDQAFSLARARDDVGVAREQAGPGLRLTATDAALDAFVRDVVLAGLAVRRLQVLQSPLERLFFALTADDAPAER